MTLEVQAFATDCLYLLGFGRGLEVGSYSVNGFPDYLGWNMTKVDMRPGPNVGIVANSHDLPFSDETFECALWLETLEHDANPEKTLCELHRCLKPGAALIITTPSPGYPKHDHPQDYWRVTQEGLEILLLKAKFESVATCDEGFRSPRPGTGEIQESLSWTRGVARKSGEVTSWNVQLQDRVKIWPMSRVTV